MDCIFCSLVTQEPQNKIGDNNSFVAFLDLNPVSNGHTIIVPRRHIESFFDLNSTENSDLKGMLSSLRNVLKEKVKPDGFNIGVNDGEAAGATQKHILIHMIPRHKGDVSNPAGGIRNILGMQMEAKREEPKVEVKEEPKPEPKKVEIPKEPPKPRTWQDLLEDARKRQKENERLILRNKFK